MPKQDKGSRRLVTGIMETGSCRITDGESERQFKNAMRAIVDAIDDFGEY